VEVANGSGITQMATENYTLGYGESSMEWMESRTAEGHGAFLLPYLKPGMRLLDCGCGPGTLTIGFARHVAPAEAIGIDRDSMQFTAIAAEAQREQVSNLRFEAGDIYALPYADQSFDVVFGSAVLGSVANAAAVVTEMIRVLKTGGIIALKEFDHGADIIWPQTPTIARSIELYHRLRAENGHEPHAGRRLKEFLTTNGCHVEYLNAYFDQQTESNELQTYIDRNNGLHREILGPQYCKLGWCTPEDIDVIVSEWREFAANPAAIYLAGWLEAIGVKE
jgi:ubiquinone/menaquinone biosynthesis C-methylase UbiE